MKESIQVPVSMRIENTKTHKFIASKNKSICIFPNPDYIDIHQYYISEYNYQEEEITNQGLVPKLLIQTMIDKNFHS
tara:strand:+ start:2525 stop:2755 length:231 start_codon:yes stop_codon:yes gene_type:complete